MDMILDRDQSWDEITVFFPQHAQKTHEQRVDQLTRLLDSVTHQIPEQRQADAPVFGKVWLSC